ncbi:MAG: tetrahydromethanopterin S-methyltransferase subunit A [Candidatus Thermoplasmatota archaeon]|nr:tetrahydromethanopterin S-methyltransferase subunit A [Euryarchaeota archaeon]MBU4032697.1 tetrahydromethanopterin S-methyltransferase subunit A [Candidatus Thermoplasmatota archaeon]MBU4071670.1 tetrahydromethanopterin S-methyltransferase subunit A [Candidatus Thermoplasmatota archaeon]MBU4145302.1 tetrahydromethanopterin S-methyltransferase subunit A [Candidatus Thermoplasmatota archaeon]MBU4591071.1 tetrahydromethanopterin S-methyltransferase subunit A [Candidatus Thermoplasmatota archaeo
MMYPWRGEFTIGSPNSQIAIDTLSSKMNFPPELVAIWGQHKTENLGVEKIIANVVSNPNIRYLILCGQEVRGHRSGQSLRALHSDGIDGNGRIIGARGAVPYIENVSAEAIARFREQVELVDMIGTDDLGIVLEKVKELSAARKEPFGEPIIMEFVERDKSSRMKSLTGKISIHKDLLVDPYMEVEIMNTEAEQC